MKTIIALLLLTFNTSAFSFDTESYCKEVAQAGGGSYMIYEQCLKQENAARNRVEPQSNSKKAAPKIKDKTLKKDMKEFDDYMMTVPRYSVLAESCLENALAAEMRDNFIYLYELYSALHEDFPEVDPPLLDQVLARGKTWKKIDSEYHNYDKNNCINHLVGARAILSVKKSKIKSAIERLRKQGKPIPPSPSVI